MYRTLMRLLVMGVLLTSAFGGCGKLSNEGQPPPNNAPKVYFANIPVDGTTFSTNPTVYWYGTDNDGTVEKYEYSVRPDTVVRAYLADHGITGTEPPPELFIKHATEDAFEWITIWVDSVQTATRGAIRLYASFDTNYVVQVDQTCNPPCTTYLIDCETDSVDFTVVNGDTVAVRDTTNCVSASIQQYMFVRAVDDDNQPSAIKYREFLRNNHWPQTKIEAAIPFSNGLYLNIPRPKVTYQGITIGWSASDSSDYPRNQPDFEYWWRVFGPFSSREAADTTDPAKLVMDSGDSLVGDDWIRKPTGIWTTTKSATMIDLWRHEPASPTTRQSFFLFEIRARDDAFALDPTPSRVTFEVVDAKLERPILFVDDCNYTESNLPLTPMGSGATADGPVNRTLLRERIIAIIRDATDGRTIITPDSMSYYRRDNTDLAAPTYILPLNLLAKFALVLVVDDDASSPIHQGEQEQLAQYLNIGGKVWVFGRDCFLAEGKNPKSFEEPKVWPVGAMPEFYFDAEYIYLSAWWKRAFPYSCLGLGKCPMTEGIDDFIAATPTLHGVVEGFLPLQVDTKLTADYLLVGGFRNFAEKQAFRFTAIPEANFLVRGTAAEPLYTYVSRYGGAEYTHDKVCAIRFVGPSALTPVFKTAWFSFSPYGIKHQQIVEVFKKMLAWFEE